MSENHPPRSDTVFLIGRIIDAWVEFRRRRTLIRMIIMSLITGGVAVLAVSGVVQIILILLDKPLLDYLNIIVGSLLIATGIGLYFMEGHRDSAALSDVEFEPTSSFFAAHKNSKDDKDARYIDGRTFQISSYFRVKSGAHEVFISRMMLYAYSDGISCLPLDQRFFIESKEILYSKSTGLTTEDDIHPEYRHDGDYYLEPSIRLPPLDVVNISITRDFGPPFQGVGAPVDFQNADLKLIVEYVTAGETRHKTFTYSTNYALRSLKRTRGISEITYFTDREISYWLKEKAITKKQRDLLLSVDPETRIRVLNGSHKTERKATLAYQLPPGAFDLLQDLDNRYSDLPSFEPDAVWRTPLGRFSHWIIERLSPR